MSDKDKKGRTVFDFFIELIEQSRYWIIILIAIFFFVVWFIAHWSTEPGEQVSIWGLIKYTKKFPSAPTPFITKPTFTPSPKPTSDSISISKPTPIPTQQPEIILTVTPMPPNTLTPTIAPIPTHDVAVFVIDEGNEINWDIGNNIVSILREKGIGVTNLSSDVFVSNRSFEKVFGGDANEVKRLGLFQYSENIILGRILISFIDNPDMENMITANASLEIHVVSSKTGIIEDSFTIAQKGPGFSKADAKKIAIERIFQELEGRIGKTIKEF